MIKGILYSSLFILLVLSFYLYFGGVTESAIGDGRIDMFLYNVNSRFNSWKLTIPTIKKLSPEKPLDIGQGSIGWLLQWIVYGLGNFINFIIGIINIIIVLLNAIISVIQFLLTLIYSFKDWLALYGTVGSLT